MRALVSAAAGLALAACGELVLLNLDGSVWKPNGRPITIRKPIAAFPFTTRRGAGFWAGQGLARPGH